MPNFFEFYQLPVAFNTNQALLKRRYYELNRQYHPDFHTQSDTPEQEQALEMASVNNKAYQTLSRFETRMKHILELFGMLVENEKYQLPQTFLMEMMEINETLMELPFADDPAATAAQTAQTIQAIEAAMLNAITPALAAFDQNPQQTELLQAVKEFYYKNRYLLRIKESLRNFAPH
ncbi:MAG TPA: iron-sulfur cluster co-chaperone HscB C-terminal domain-containing protein [Chitinophagales bacterium]|nr:iron-sulfur cluster co-chaperone HscB C-terminal domain-containing protein [Chitinophagales bacterium]